jgi:hypothetical protein
MHRTSPSTALTAATAARPVIPIHPKTPPPGLEIEPDT